ncbi:MAG: metallophosphoesterase [bacterium]
MGETRLFFATDIHGSDWCFRKFLNAAKAYKADVMVLGGDITGKQLVPIVPDGNGGWNASEGGASIHLKSKEERETLEKRAAMIGAYTIELDGPEQEERLREDVSYRNQRFLERMEELLESWMGLADERLRPQDIPLYMMLGNDDEKVLAAVIEGSDWVQQSEGKVLTVDSEYEMASWGWSTPTPWDSPREQSEEEMVRAIEAVAAGLKDPERAILNVHCPPFHSGIDEAPELDDEFRPVVKGGQLKQVPVGSRAVRDVIERYQPLMGLHGHVHEASGTQTVGRTRCFNPGSNYQHGVLRGVMIRLKDGKLRDWTFTRG